MQLRHLRLDIFLTFSKDLGVFEDYFLTKSFLIKKRVDNYQGRRLWQSLKSVWQVKYETVISMEGEDPQDHLTWITCQTYKVTKAVLGTMKSTGITVNSSFLRTATLWNPVGCFFLLLDLTSFTLNVTKRFYIGALSDEDS